jgi:hypothetical protein
MPLDTERFQPIKKAWILMLVGTLRGIGPVSSR